MVHRGIESVGGESIAYLSWGIRQKTFVIHKASSSKLDTRPRAFVGFELYVQ